MNYIVGVLLTALITIIYIRLVYRREDRTWDRYVVITVLNMMIYTVLRLAFGLG